VRTSASDVRSGLRGPAEARTRARTSGGTAGTKVWARISPCSSATRGVGHALDVQVLVDARLHARGVALQDEREVGLGHGAGQGFGFVRILGREVAVHEVGEDQGHDRGDAREAQDHEQQGLAEEPGALHRSHHAFQSRMGTRSPSRTVTK
jgi:hypothetical protein